MKKVTILMVLLMVAGSVMADKVWTNASEMEQFEEVFGVYCGVLASSTIILADKTLTAGERLAANRQLHAITTIPLDKLFDLIAGYMVLNPDGTLIEATVYIIQMTALTISD